MAAKESSQGFPDTAVDAGFELANLLDTGLDRDAVRIIMQLCDCGVNPEALAAVIKELRAEAARVKAEAAAHGKK